jgi:D-glycero-D-manno-heptose 1,7-bisphosphate phosphatase
MQKKAIFLDRDGVINKEKNYLYKKEDFEFIDGVFEACKYFQEVGYQLIVVTNQSGISRGYYQEEDFHKITEWMLEQFESQSIKILDVFFCPHGPESTCNCRKPKPGMLLEAKEKYNIDMQYSWMIGDKEADIGAANAAEVKNTILVKTGHEIDEVNSNAKFILKSMQDTIEIIK